MRTRVLPLLLALHVLLVEIFLRAFFDRICLIDTASYFVNSSFRKLISIFLLEFFNRSHVEQGG